MRFIYRTWKEPNLLKVKTPSTYLPERTYILHVLLGEFLGLDYELQPSESLTETIITDDQNTLTITDIFFKTPESKWLTPASLPKLPLSTWTSFSHPEIADLPIIFGQRLRENEYFLAEGANALLGLDVFGSAFFMLTRYEELIDPSRDARNRFPASASLAAKSNFLMRPIINEYLEVLWAALTHAFPRLNKNVRSFRVFLSHDVDQPFGGAGRSIVNVARSMAGDIKKHRPVSSALQRAKAYLQRDFEHDFCNTFDFLMTESEKRGFVSAFYFISGHSGGRIDGDYELEQPHIQALLREIHARGHEIGLHPSYNTFRNGSQLIAEFNRLRAVCAELKIQQTAWGGRQHYLRWENPTTWQIWHDAGLAYDSSLTFSDSVGFRAGICYEYPVFDLKQRQQLALRERPLVIMEVSLWDYMGIPETDVDNAYERILPLMQTCHRFQGDFSLLWHNNNFRFPAQKVLYTRLLESCANPAKT